MVLERDKAMTSRRAEQAGVHGLNFDLPADLHEVLGRKIEAVRRMN